MDNTNDLNPTAADPAEAEKDSAATELGKFRDVRALMDAYNSLEAEFTRRSQRLRELEKAEKENGAPAEADTALPPPQGQLRGASLLEAVRQDEEVKAAIISEYLLDASKNRGVPFVTGGVNVPARRRTPASVREAGELAQQFLNKRR